MALEFINLTESDFWGEHNVIRKGGTFYIVGELKLADGKKIDANGNEVSAFWPDEVDANDLYVIPPYKADNKVSEKIKRIFIQDYKTTAHFRLGPNALKHAYVTVPDLRSSQMSLGLSVDLQWRQGYTYNVVLGPSTNEGTTAGN